MKGINYDWYLCKQHATELKRQGNVQPKDKVAIVPKGKCEQCHLLKARGIMAKALGERS